jgi:hypothetical protein
MKPQTAKQQATTTTTNTYDPVFLLERIEPHPTGTTKKVLLLTTGIYLNVLEVTAIVRRSLVAFGACHDCYMISVWHKRHVQSLDQRFVPS